MGHPKGSVKKTVQINVTYEGAHNFDWDTQLEEIAGKVRHDSSMDFDNMQRTISFRFEDQVPEEGAEAVVTRSALFMAAVRSAFPEFVVGVE